MNARPALIPVLILVLLISGIAKSQAPGAGGLGDSLYPHLGNGGYDVLHYDIDLRFDAERNHISATTAISATALDDLSSFNLDLYQLTVDSVRVDGARAAFERQASELIIRPAEALVKGADFSVTVAYGGQPVPISDPGVPFTKLGWIAWDDGYFAAVSEPSGAMNWFPSNNHPSDKASYTMRITVPSHLSAAANGVLTELKANDDGTRTFVWRMEEPMATYLTIVAVGDYVERRDETGPVPIRNYFPRGTDDEVINGYSVTQQIMTWLIDTIGPYPFEEYGVVVLPGFPAALETQTLSAFGDDAPDPLTIVHELLHQWFGNSVTPASWGDIWLNEGFATFFMALYLEKTFGVETGEQFFEVPPDLPPPGNIEVAELFGASVYLRGALTLQALRAEVGDAVFFDILREYYARHAYSVAATADFIAAAEAVSGRQLDQLFDAWLYSAEMPSLP